MYPRGLQVVVLSGGKIYARLIVLAKFIRLVSFLFDEAYTYSIQTGYASVL